MTDLELRDYFAAHAPSKPPKWFKPQMAEWHKQPPYPLTLHGVSARTLQDWKGDPHAWDINVRDPAQVHPQDRDTIEEYVAALKEHWKLNDQLRKDYDRARCVQWPYAWADALLEERREVR